MGQMMQIWKSNFHNWKKNAKQYNQMEKQITFSTIETKNFKSTSLNPSLSFRAGQANVCTEVTEMSGNTIMWANHLLLPLPHEESCILVTIKDEGAGLEEYLAQGKIEIQELSADGLLKIETIDQNGNIFCEIICNYAIKSPCKIQQTPTNDPAAAVQSDQNKQEVNNQNAKTEEPQSNTKSEEKQTLSTNKMVNSDENCQKNQIPNPLAQSNKQDKKAEEPRTQRRTEQAQMESKRDEEKISHTEKSHEKHRIHNIQKKNEAAKSQILEDQSNHQHSRSNFSKLEKSNHPIRLPVLDSKNYGDKIFEKQSSSTLQKSIHVYSLSKANRFAGGPKYNGEPTFVMDTCFKTNSGKGVGFGFGNKRQFPDWMERNMKENPAPGAYFDFSMTVQDFKPKGPSFGLPYKYYEKVMIPKQKNWNQNISNRKSPDRLLQRR